MKTKYLLLFAAIGCAANFVLAEDITTLDGKK